MNRKIDELKRNLDTQITESINSAIHDSIPPSIQNSLSGQNSGLGTNVDSSSSRLSRNTEGKKHQSAWGNTQNRIQSNLNNHPHSRDDSMSSLDCRDDHDSWRKFLTELSKPTTMEFVVWLTRYSLTSEDCLTRSNLLG